MGAARSHPRTQNHVRACRFKIVHGSRTRSVPPHPHEQVARSNLGPDDFEEKKVLDAALRKAQSQATVPPLEEQIAHTTKFLPLWLKAILAQGHFGSSHFCSNLTLLQRVEEVFFCCARFRSYFCIPKVVPWFARDGLRRTFPRDFRGPRPLSQEWPKRSSVPSTQFLRRVNPDSSREVARLKLMKLEKDVGGDGRRRWSCWRVGESSECGEAETSPTGGGHSVREAHLRVV